MKYLPIGLIWLRLFLGIFLLFLCWIEIPNFSIWATILVSLGLLSDIFDGIIARRLQISTTTLRRLDSTIDQLFFCAVALTTYWRCPEFFRQNSTAVFVLIGLEIATYVVSFIKFKKEIATHSIGAKIWTLFLFVTLIELLWTCQSTFLFWSCIIIGIITRLEIIGIILILKQWTNDVPSIFQAWRIRKGKEMNRNKWFNG